MNNSLVTVCIVFSLFYLASAKSLLTYKQITEELGNLTKMFDREIDCNSSLVPKIGEMTVKTKKITYLHFLNNDILMLEMQNVSAAEISCRAIESLKSVCRKERQHLHALEHYLAFVKTHTKKISQVVKCDVSEEEEDIISFLRSLREYFRYKIFNHKP